MGKRRLHGASFYQCDWTGFSMRQAFCYMPVWTAAGKLQKKGSYCNWESVIAHAKYQHQLNEIDADALEKIKEHVAGICGTPVEAAPYYEDLLHTKGRLTAWDFHEKCTFERNPITGVKISPNGEVFEVLLMPDQSSKMLGKFVFEEYLHKPFSYHGPPSSFHSMRKKGQKPVARALTVWYYNVKELPHNATASNLFKMQLYGDVLLVQQSREQSFKPRERYVSFNKVQFDEQFNKKRKRASDTLSLAPAAYAELKQTMQSQLDQYEQAVARDAVPASTGRAQTVEPPSSGRALAAEVKARAGGPTPAAPQLPPAVFLQAVA